MRNYLTSNPAILKEARDYLNGLVLGDGHIRCVSSGTGYYQQTCKYKSWLDKISEDLYEYGIECIVDNGLFRTGGFCPEGGSVEYMLYTRSYIEFKEMHDRFYKKWYDVDKYPKKDWHKDIDGEYFIWKKIVPRDICLSPVCLANEYLGDGNIFKSEITLATNGLLREDIIFLSELLSETLDIKCSITKRGEIGIYNKFGVSTFLDYVKDYKVNCYSKKFPDII